MICLLETYKPMCRFPVNTQALLIVHLKYNAVLEISGFVLKTQVHTLHDFIQLFKILCCDVRDCSSLQVLSEVFSFVAAVSVSTAFLCSHSPGRCTSPWRIAVFG